MPGGVTSLAWTSDGCSLGVGWEKALGIWTVAGRKTFVGTRKKQPIEEDKAESRISMAKGGDEYLNGVSTLVSRLVHRDAIIRLNDVLGTSGLDRR